MPAATSKSELISVTQKEWAKLQRLIAEVPEDLATAKDAEDTSIKDVLAHRAHWLGLLFQWLEEGEAAQTPDHGVKWSELKPYNAALRERYGPMSWPEVRTWLSKQHARFSEWLNGAEDATLYAGPMPGGNGRWTTGRYAEAAGPSHYRSASKYIRQRLRDTA